MKVTDLDLQKMLRFEPESGRLLLGGDRMLLFRQDALASLRQLLVDQLGDLRARAILAQFGHRCGAGDFDTLSRNYDWETEIDRMGAGPALHTWEGIVHVEPTFLEFDRAAGHFHMRGIWRNSYEAEIHRDLYGICPEPVCHTLTGYASGWCSAFFGKPTIAIETKCAGAGADRCEFEIRRPDAWGPEADPWKAALLSTEGSLSRELEAKLAVIAKQEVAISELTSPVMEIWEDVLLLPIVGVVDTRRSMEIMNNLLESIERTKSRCVIIDVTGVEVVDTKTADYLIKVMRAAALLGSRCVLTGLSSAIAQTLVEVGADLSEVRTLRGIKEGLKDSLKFLRRQQET
ncbi:MAG TPA: XylR N-terminal domain-containing protein [Nannocystaceae bacterium]|nr:XylR N-terminal domain-containing protein [Nannocystaceae bacterium]